MVLLSQVEFSGAGSARTHSLSLWLSCLDEGSVLERCPHIGDPFRQAD